jgi:hypothetical protein
MTPSALVSTVIADRSRCWLPAGHDGLRPEQAMALRHEPQDGGKACSIGHPGGRIVCKRRARRMTRDLDRSPLLRPRQPNPHSAC